MNKFMTIVIICGLLICCKNKKVEEKLINSDSCINLSNNDTHLYENERVILTKEFKVKKIPNPVATVACRKGGTITKEELAAQRGVSVQMENFNDMDIHFNVAEFTLTTVSKNGKVIENTSHDTKFTEAQIKQLNKLKSGDKVYFENIIAILMEGKKENLGSLMFKIK